MGGEGEEVGGVEGREIVIRIYCVRKESVFRKKGQEEKK